MDTLEEYFFRYLEVMNEDLVSSTTFTKQLMLNIVELLHPGPSSAEFAAPYHGQDFAQIVRWARRLLTQTQRERSQ